MNKLYEIRKKVFEMSIEEQKKFIEMCGSIVLWENEARSIGYMAEKLNLKPWQVEQNMDEMLYVLMKRIGKWKFLKMLFMK